MSCPSSCSNSSPSSCSNTTRTLAAAPHATSAGLTDAYIYVALSGQSKFKDERDPFCVFIDEKECFCKCVLVKELEPKEFREGLRQVVLSETDFFFFVVLSDAVAKPARPCYHVMKYPKQVAFQRYASGELRAE